MAQQTQDSQDAGGKKRGRRRRAPAVRTEPARRKTLAEASAPKLASSIRHQAVQQRLPAGLDGHELYFEECGNPQRQARGVPARRPGRRHRSEDAPLLRSEALSHRAVRSARLAARAGRMRASIDNTTWDLVADIESACASTRHRQVAGVRRLVGLDAGARLRARRIPSACTEMVLRGIFLLRRSELEWFYQNALGAARCSRICGKQYVEVDSGSRARRHDGRPTTSASPATDKTVLERAREAWSVWEGAHELSCD